MRIAVVNTSHWGIWTENLFSTFPLDSLPLSFCRITVGCEDYKSLIERANNCGIITDASPTKKKEAVAQTTLPTKNGYTCTYIHQCTYVCMLCLSCYIYI